MQIMKTTAKDTLQREQWRRRSGAAADADRTTPDMIAVQINTADNGLAALSLSGEQSTTVATERGEDL